jgi:hypothetical protein
MNDIDELNSLSIAPSLTDKYAKDDNYEDSTAEQQSDVQPVSNMKKKMLITRE